MFRIGEFSKLTQVTIRMLRYYDEVGLLKPEQIDPWTSYRMNSVEQIPILIRVSKGSLGKGAWHFAQGRTPALIPLYRDKNF